MKIKQGTKNKTGIIRSRFKDMLAHNKGANNRCEDTCYDGIV